MKNLISLVLVLFATNVFAATGSGNISNTVNLGGTGVSPNLTINESNSQGYFTLYSSAVTLTAPNHGVLYKNGVAYQVPVGKTFKMVKICATEASGPSNFQLFTATASFANNAASVTGGVYSAGVISNSTFKFFSNTLYTCIETTYDFAASTYAGYQGGATGNYYVFVVGKEI